MKYRVTARGKTWTRTSHRQYTHAVIPVYTTRTTWVPSAARGGRTVPEAEPREPYDGAPQFCGSLALARKACKPGWILVEVEVEGEETSYEA